MTNLYPIQCVNCQGIIGYSETDFNNTNDTHHSNYCELCIEITLKEKRK